MTTNVAVAGKSRNPAKKGRAKKKKGMALWKKIALGVLGLIGFVVWYGFQPIKGPIQVGICRTYIDLVVPYPWTVKINVTEVFDRSQRLYFTYMTSFGGYRSSMIDCKFATDPVTGQPVLQDISIDRRSIGPEKVKVFAATIPAVVAADPDLIIPFPLGDDMIHLKKD